MQLVPFRKGINDLLQDESAFFARQILEGKLGRGDKVYLIISGTLSSNTQQVLQTMPLEASMFK